MIQVRDLSKSFGPRKALDRVCLSIGAGECVALMGPNGAGKTTLLRILASLSRPTSGTVHVAGLDPRRDGAEVGRRIGFLSHQTLLYDDLTAEQNLRFYAHLYDLGAASQRVDELLKRVGLDVRRGDRVRALSRGMQQRLAVARAILHHPQVLLLDEPFAGLDLQAVQALASLLEELVEEDCTILMATHSLERGLALGRRVIVLKQGSIVYDRPREVIDSTVFAESYRALTT
ncbi:MAG: heme ABC exporter ATP-binding protein CcmA [Anaerolineae bacterium]|jgi:heme exporter protein A